MYTSFSVKNVPNLIFHTAGIKYCQYHLVFSLPDRYFQPAVDAISLALMREFNASSRNASSKQLPLIYVTYQAYLRRCVIFIVCLAYIEICLELNHTWHKVCLMRNQAATLWVSNSFEAHTMTRKGLFTNRQALQILIHLYGQPKTRQTNALMHA